MTQISSQLTEIQNKLNDLENCFKTQPPKEYLTRGEVVELLSISLSTLSVWSKNGTLIRHCIGNRVYYKRSEIDQAMVALTSRSAA